MFLTMCDRIKFKQVYIPTKVYQSNELECVNRDELLEAFHNEAPMVGYCHFNAVITTTIHSVWGTPIEYVEGLALSKRRTYHQGMIHCWNKTTDNNGNTVYFDVTPLGCQYDYVVLREFINFNLYNFQDQYLTATCSLFVMKIDRHYEYYTNDGCLHKTTRMLDGNTAMNNEMPLELKGRCWEYVDLDGNPRKRRPTDCFNII